MKSRVYIADVSPLLDSELYSRLLSQVPEYRQNKSRRFKFQSGRAQSLAAGLLLRRACEDFQIPGADANVVLGENGKPEFAEAFFENGTISKVHFNLSHSHERAMCIMSPHEVGCDVEQVGNDRSSIAEKFFLPAENRWIQAAGSTCDGLMHDNDESTNNARDVAFYRLWTLKECYMKVTGLGLSLSPDKFSLEIKNGDCILLHHEKCRSEYVFREFDFDDGYRYAYCLRNAEPNECAEVVKVDLRLI